MENNEIILADGSRSGLTDIGQKGLEVIKERIQSGKPREPLASPSVGHVSVT